VKLREKKINAFGKWDCGSGTVELLRDDSGNRGRKTVGAC